MGQDKHLFVLIHGLWGNYKHMKSLEKVLDATLNGKKSGKDKDYVFFCQNKMQPLRLLMVLRL